MCCPFKLFILFTAHLALTSGHEETVTDYVWDFFAVPVQLVQQFVGEAAEGVSNVVSESLEVFKSTAKMSSSAVAKVSEALKSAGMETMNKVLDIQSSLYHAGMDATNAGIDLIGKLFSSLPFINLLFEIEGQQMAYVKQTHYSGMLDRMGSVVAHEPVDVHASTAVAGGNITTSENRASNSSPSVHVKQAKKSSASNKPSLVNASSHSKGH